MGIDYRQLVRGDRVHGSLLHDSEVFAEEMERIFVRGWAFVGHESEIKNNGDWVNRQLGNESVIMVRDDDGDIGVLSHRCAHRSIRLFHLNLRIRTLGNLLLGRRGPARGPL